MKVNSCVTDAHEINSDELKTTMKESPRRYTNPFLSDQENDELNLWNNQEHEHELSINEDNSITNLENEPVQPLQKAKEVYVDKKVTECQLPELMNVFHVVKDICVDNGISHDEKIEVDKKHHELSCNHVTVTNTDTDTETETDHYVNGDKYDDGISQNEKIEVDRKHHELSCNHVTVTNTDTDTDHTVIGDKYDDGISHDEKIEVDEKHHELSCNHVTVNDTDTDTDIDHTVNGDKHDDVIENEQIISSPKEDCSKITNVEKPEGEEVEIVKPDTQIGPNQLQRGGGESSFSMVASVSGRIAYSGSISHRSDGSNTSVRSFAFPILQTEWNSSPVRMAKVDQRQSRKHRGWRQALMCCGF